MNNVKPMARRGPRSARFRRGAAAFAGSGFVLASPCHAIDFAQLDASRSSTTVVAVQSLRPSEAGRPSPQVTAAATRWRTGSALGLSGVARWAVVDGPHAWVVGAGAGLDRFEDRSGPEPSRSAVSVRAQAEWFGPTPVGHYYGLVQASSFRQSRLLVLQHAFARGVAVELTHYHDRGYESIGAGLRLPLPAERWYWRIGALRAEGSTTPFVGVAYNAF